eukprot:gene19481-23337_t
MSMSTCTVEPFCRYNTDFDLFKLCYDRLPGVFHTSTTAFDLTCGSGSLDIVRYLHERDVLASVDAIRNAAAKGSLDIVQYLCEKRSEGYTSEAVDAACRGGYLDVVVFLMAEKSVKPTRDAFIDAAENGHTEILSFIIDMDGPFAQPLAMGLCKAASGGHLDTVQLIHGHIKEPMMAREMAIQSSCKAGKIESVKFILSLYEDVPELELAQETLKSPFEYGQDHIITMFSEKGLYGNLDFKICIPHLHNCSLATIKMVVDKCIHDSTVQVDTAKFARDGRLDVLEYIHSSSIPSWWNSSLMAAAGHNHHLVALFLLRHRKEFIDSNSVLIQDALIEATRTGSLQVIEAIMLCHPTLTELLCSRILKMAFIYDHFYIKEWIVETYPEQCNHLIDK